MPAILGRGLLWVLPIGWFRLQQDSGLELLGSQSLHLLASLTLNLSTRTGIEMLMPLSVLLFGLWTVAGPIPGSVLSLVLVKRKILGLTPHSVLGSPILRAYALRRRSSWSILWGS